MNIFYSKKELNMYNKENTFIYFTNKLGEFSIMYNNTSLTGAQFGRPEWKYRYAYVYNGRKYECMVLDNKLYGKYTFNKSILSVEELIILKHCDWFVNV